MNKKEEGGNTEYTYIFIHLIFFGDFKGHVHRAGQMPGVQYTTGVSFNNFCFHLSSIFVVVVCNYCTTTHVSNTSQAFKSHAYSSTVRTLSF